MSSFKLNDPLAPTYRRNYRTHLALEEDEGHGSGDTSRRSSVQKESSCPVRSDRGLKGVDSFDDEAPLLAAASDGSLNPPGSRLRDDAPEDKGSFVQLAFFLFGLVSLLPWNFFITASEYWMFKFRDVQSPNGNRSHSIVGSLPPEVHEPSKTPLQSEFFSALSIASNVPFLIMLYLAAMLNEKVPARIRNPAALVGVVIVFASVTALIVVDTDSWQQWFYRLTLVQMLLVAGSSAVFQGGIMGVASTFPSEYSHACVVGQSAGGVFASILQVAIILLNVSATSSALIYFSMALVLLSSSVFVLFRTQRTAFYRYFSRYSAPNQGSIQEPSIATSQEEELLSTVHENNFEVKVRTGFVVRKLWHYCVALVLVYAVTIGAFPGVLVHVEPSAKANGGLWTRLFSPVACFLVFNVGDLLGRLLASSSWMPAIPARREGALLVGLTSMRVLFWPLLFACNVQPRAEPSMALPVLFESDAVFVLINSLFAASNGYLTSCAMVQGPKRLDPCLQEKAGAVMVAMLATGTATGSVISLLFVKAFFHPQAH